jgi:hypothetical protein
MKRNRIRFALLLIIAMAAPAFARVQTVGDVSFAVPEGWAYQGASNGGAMVMKQGANFWIVSVHAARPTTGDPVTDYRAAWRSEVQTVAAFQSTVLEYTPSDISGTLGYPGKVYSGNNGQLFIRLYTLNAGSAVVPVTVITQSRQVLDVMEHLIAAVVSSVRVAPLKASPIRNSLSMADLTGDWKSGTASSRSYYDRYNGSYVGSSMTAVGAEYHIAGNGSFTYRLNGMINNQVTRDQDTGVVELGGEFVTFKGRVRTTRFRFLNIQTAIDGSTVMMLLPVEADKPDIIIASRQEQWERQKPNAR